MLRSNVITVPSLQLHLPPKTNNVGAAGHQSALRLCLEESAVSVPAKVVSTEEICNSKVAEFKDTVQSSPLVNAKQRARGPALCGYAVGLAAGIMQLDPKVAANGEVRLHCTASLAKCK